VLFSNELVEKFFSGGRVVVVVVDDEVVVVIGEVAFRIILSDCSPESEKSLSPFLSTQE